MVAAYYLLEVEEFLNRKKRPFYFTGIRQCSSPWRVGSGRWGGSWSATTRITTHSTTENLGCFGKFESINDSAHLLLDAATFEAAAGPEGSSRHRLLHELPLRPVHRRLRYAAPGMMNHNPPYYAGLLKSCRICMPGGSKRPVQC